MSGEEALARVASDGWIELPIEARALGLVAAAPKPPSS